MAIHKYRDFVLIADDVEKGADGRVAGFEVSVFDSPAGQGEKREKVSIPDDLFKWLRRLEQRRLDRDPGAQMDLGAILAALLLPAYARSIFAASLARLGDGEGLRLRLRLADELADFPWEMLYLHAQRGERTAAGFLALDPRISIARHEALAVPGDWFEAPGSRRVVVATATPEPHDRYPELTGLADEQRRIRETLERQPGIEAVFVPANAGSGQAGATLRDLSAVLDRRTDVFHFSGHGEFAEEMGPAFGSQIGRGGILLADADNRAVPVRADRLAELLRGKGVRVVLLGACETGRRDGVNIWSGVAAALLEARIPAVVAMQYTIKDALAAAFCAAFYRALVAGLTLDEAVAAGRTAIRIAATGDDADVRDWAVPVLYLRSPGGVVFNPVRDDAAQAAAQATEQLVEQTVDTVTAEGRVIAAAAGTVKSSEVKIEQKVNEKLEGFVLGASVFAVQGGRLTVRQKAKVVSGTLVGAKIGNLGSGRPSTGGEDEALRQLENYLRLEPAISLTEGKKYCQDCGQQLDTGAKFCPQCGLAQR